MTAQAEAEGKKFVSASFRGRDWRLPLDVDSWPLTAVTCSIGVNPKREAVVSHAGVGEAIRLLLGEQWESFLSVAPRRRELVPASHAFASAVGMGPTQDRGPDGRLYDRVWGAIPRVLAVLETWPTAVESDLSRFWGIDYRDRWRFDSSGGRLLTLRQIFARISHLPADSALAIEMGRRSPSELLLMDLYEPLAGRVHPARPLTPEQLAERRAKEDAKAKAMAEYERRREQQGHRKIPAVLETARENARRGEISAQETD